MNTTTATPWDEWIGSPILVRTETMNIVGRLVEVGAQELVLTDAALVTFIRRWTDVLKSGDFSRVEPFPGRVVVGQGAVIDSCGIDVNLPLDKITEGGAP